MTGTKIKNLTLAAMLTALTIIIPLAFTPLRVVVGPYTATLMAHVPVIIAMFISAPIAVFVAVCSGIGFFMCTPLIVAIRALTHVFFAFAGAKMIKSKKINMIVIIALTAVIHAFAEAVVVYAEALITTNSIGAITNTAITFVGTFCHHCVDFAIAFIGLKALKAAKLISSK